MPRAKKENTPVSFRISTAIYERLKMFCEKSGQSKTVAVERAITMYIDEFETKQALIDERESVNHN